MRDGSSFKGLNCDLITTYTENNSKVYRCSPSSAFNFKIINNTLFIQEFL